jgi:hypothetical protein
MTDERYLTRRAQGERYGVCARTIVRWADDPALGYPEEIDINGRKFRALSKLEAWERQRAAIAAKMPRKPWSATPEGGLTLPPMDFPSARADARALRLRLPIGSRSPTSAR